MKLNDFPYFVVYYLLWAFYVIDRKPFSDIIVACVAEQVLMIILFILHPTRRIIECARLYVTYLAHDRTRLYGYTRQYNILLSSYIDRYTRKSTIYACTTQPIQVYCIYVCIYACDAVLEGETLCRTTTTTTTTTDTQIGSYACFIFYMLLL